MRRWLGLTVVALALLGAGSASGSPAPPSPEGALTGIAQISAGGAHTCARLTNGQVRCWGSNGLGQLGDGTNTSSSTPVTVRNATNTDPLTGVTHIAAGGSHTCAKLTSGQVRCWGINSSGQLGNGTTTASTLPVAVQNASGGRLTDVLRLGERGGSHACALLTSRQLRCWGNGLNGELGHGATTSQTRSVAVRAVSGSGNLSGVARLALGSGHTCARLLNGQVRCWGAGSFGRLGDGTEVLRSRPVAVRRPVGASGPLSGVDWIAAGFGHSCAALDNGQARCWGRNDQGGVGNDTTMHAIRPVVVLAPAGSGALAGVRSLTGGEVHTCARLSSGQLRCWGFNSSGQLGDDTTTRRTRPVIVLNEAGNGPLEGVASITSGQSHTCALLGSGQARCWGSNGLGRLGDGTTTQRLRPVAVLG